MKSYLKFSCIYCGQRMECETHLRGRQILCPACQHRIVIPAAHNRESGNRLFPHRDTWDTWVPMPIVELPARLLNYLFPNRGLAQQAG